ncbi:MAG: glycosyltransferase family 4 protein [Pseudomonadota bacterium]
MKILHLMPAMNPGGAVQGPRSLIRLLSSAHHTVFVFEPKMRGIDLVAFMQEGAKVLRSPGAETLHAEITAADVVLVHGFNHPALIQALAGPLPDARWVVWFQVIGRSMPQLVFPERLDPGVVSVFMAEPKTAGEGDWPVIPGMVRPEFVHLERQPHEGVVVDYIGSMNIAKLHPGAIRFLDAVHHPGLKIRIHGGPLNQEMRADLNRATRPECFDIGGFANDVPALLATSDIFISPMAPDSYASSDLALQEAMHAGLVPVVLGEGGPAAMITDRIDGRVTTTGDDFTAAIQVLCDDEDARNRMGTAAKKTALDRFDPVKNADRMAQILDARALAPKSPYGYTVRKDLSPAALYLISQGWEEDVAVAALANDRRQDLERFAASLGHVAATVEGGLIQWRNACPDDANLRWMSGVWHEATGAHAIAHAEFASVP